MSFLETRPNDIIPFEEDKYIKIPIELNKKEYNKESSLGCYRKVSDSIITQPTIISNNFNQKHMHK